MTQYLDWKVGDELVCVDDSAHSFNIGSDGELLPLPSVLTEGSVYTLERIGVAANILTGDRTVCVWLAEVDGYFDGREAFPAARFRKVHPRKTSIAIFERLLLTQGNEVETA